MDRTQIRNFLTDLQDKITTALTAVNGQSFREDNWQREGGGGGRTRVYEGGEVFEKAGVNFSEVYGEFSPEFARSMPLGDGLKFYATGVSLVLHPKNPFVPTVHANYRYLERGNTGWFGGGADLTPYYFFKEDAVHFHQAHANALNPFGPGYYPEFKAKCDEYFYLPHRGETRGMGGIFFDYQEGTPEKFEMVKSCGEAFLKAYMPIVERRKAIAFEKHHKDFQEFRRGRYVEFNLLYDRGTVFGLKTNGRVESILMSLPAQVQWRYNYRPEAGTAEAELYDYLRPTDWLGLNR